MAPCVSSCLRPYILALHGKRKVWLFLSLIFLFGNHELELELEVERMLLLGNTKVVGRDRENSYSGSGSAQKKRQELALLPLLLASARTNCFVWLESWLKRSLSLCLLK